MATALVVAAHRAVMLTALDKEPTLAGVWLIAIGLGCLALVLARIRRALLVIPLAGLVVFAWQRIAALRNPYTARGIWQEGGPTYVLGTVIAILCGVLLTALAARRRGGPVPHT